jgi:hypothetical protein
MMGLLDGAGADRAPRVCDRGIDEAMAGLRDVVYKQELLGKARSEQMIENAR